MIAAWSFIQLPCVYLVIRWRSRHHSCIFAFLLQSSVLWGIWRCCEGMCKGWFMPTDRLQIGNEIVFPFGKPWRFRSTRGHRHLCAFCFRVVYLNATIRSAHMYYASPACIPMYIQGNYYTLLNWITLITISEINPLPATEHNLVWPHHNSQSTIPVALFEAPLAEPRNLSCIRKIDWWKTVALAEIICHGC